MSNSNMLEIVQGLAQAAANAYDGAHDERFMRDGESKKVGLRREEGCALMDKRVMDGFKVKFYGDSLCINYQSDIKLKEVYGGKFETEIASMLNEIKSFLQKEYKVVTGKSVSLTPKGEPEILVQSVSRVRSFVNAYQHFKISKLKMDPILAPSEKKVDNLVKEFCKKQERVMSYSLNKKEVIKEIIKCGKDPVYFVNNYCRISHPLKGSIPFNAFPYQEDLLENFNDYRFTVILKARQLGISTITAAYCVWLMLFHRDKNILVIATKFSTAGNLVKKVKNVMKNLPPWIKIASISIDNRTSFELSNGSTIKAAATSGDAGRSEALSLLVIDEAAHIDGLDELWTGLYPTLSTGGRCIALSTPNGVGNWFHKTYVDADNKENDFYPILLPWDVHPERDPAWFEKETKNMSRRQIAQELECNFNTSGDTVIHPDDIAWLTQKVSDPAYRTGHDRNFWIWEKYREEFTYLLVADVARGDGADNSVFHILKLETMEVVAEYQGKPNLDMFAQMLYSAGQEYGKCLLVVENNGIGISVLEKLITLNYENLYYSIKSTHEYIESVRAEHSDRAVPGFTTSTKTRPLIVAKLEEFVRNKVINTYSPRLLHEMTTFIWNNGKPQAMRSYNDDLVMCLAIACWVRDTAIQVNERDVQYKKAMLDSMYLKQNKMNTTIKGMDGYEQEFKDKYEKQIKTTKEFAWIFKG